MHSEIRPTCLSQAEKKLTPPSTLPCGSSSFSCRDCAIENTPPVGRLENIPPRVAVLDAVPRTRGRAYRAIRKLGHVPVTFTNVAELRAYSCREGRFETSFETLLVACPDCSAGCRQLIADVRSVLGHRLPLILSTSKNLLLEITVLEAGVADAVVVAPSSFEDTCSMLESFLNEHIFPARKHS